MHRRRRQRAWTNWSRTVRCEPSHCAYPVTVEQIQAEIVRAAEEGERVRPVGSGHSYSPLCWTDDNQLSLERFTGIESMDVERRRVWVRAGTRLHRLTDALSDRGLALDNAPDVDSVSLAGAVSTGSHGTGAAFGNLTSLVTGLRMVCADGSQRTLTPESDPEVFHAAGVSLGALGIITHVELQCVDDYRLAVRVRQSTLGACLAQLDELRHAHRNLELFWFPYTESVLLRELDTTRDYPARTMPLRLAWRQSVQSLAFRAMAESARLMPRLTDGVNRAISRRLSGRHDVRPAREAYAYRRIARFQQLEYALPLERLPAALSALGMLIKALVLRVHFPIEVRFVRRDDFWLSPHYGRDSATVAIPAYPDMGFDDYFAPIAELLERHGGRPHWGMVHDSTAANLQTMYPRFEAFCALRRQLDPRGVFLNPHLAALLGEALR